MKKLLCFLFNHKYRLNREITFTIRELECSRCKTMFAMDDSTLTFIPMDQDIKEMHDELLAHRIQYQELVREFIDQKRGEVVVASEGEDCPCNCGGTLAFSPVENCCCHIYPPCSACVDNPLTCQRCGWAEGDLIEIM